MKKISIVIVAAIIIIIAIVTVVLLGSHKSTSTTSSSASHSSTGGSTSAVTTISYSDSGFSPATTTVKSGDTIAIKNTSHSTMQLDSDPHPVHTDDTDLNVGEVDAGQTKTFTVTKTGSFGFHNHLNPSDMGKIVIQ